MEIANNQTEEKLPVLSLESKTIGTKDLQKISAKYLESLQSSGPQIVVVNGVKKAILVDYEQYRHFENRFREVFKELCVISQILPRIEIPKGFELKVDQLRVEISGTIQKIVSESPEASPFTDFMDTLMSVSMGVFGESVSAPKAMKEGLRKVRSQPVEKVEKVSARPKRNLTE